jgi:F-type H+-transporting ATPase subunit delta
MQQSGTAHFAQLYAKALFEIAKKNNNIDEIEQNFSDFISVLSENRQFNLFIDAPQIDKLKKKEIIKRLFESQFHIDFMNFLSVIIDKRRQFFIFKMYEEFTLIFDEHKGRFRIKVISAFALDDDLKKSIQHILGEKLKKEIIIDSIINKNVIGGIVLKISDVLIDGSIRKHLATLRKKLIKQKLDPKLLNFFMEQ